MAHWKKVLAAMVADPRAGSYSYSEAAGVLRALGFEVAPSSGTSHRKFRRQILDDGGIRRAVIIGLVDKGYGEIKRVYVVEMVRILRENHLLPDWV